MTKKILGTSGALAIAVLAIAAVANGPYYALPSWAQKISCAVGNCPRFIVLADWNSEAVLDRETGLVWERTPSTNTVTWRISHYICSGLSTGGRKAWRVPMVEELASLVDPSATAPPTLPPGHPFEDIQGTYWTATTQVDAPTSGAWAVGFSNGNVSDGAGVNNPRRVWCVRGGEGIESH